MCIFTLIGAHTVIYLDLLWMVGRFFHLFSTSIWYVVTALSSFLVLSILLTWLFHLGWLHSFSQNHLKTFSIPMVFSRKPNSSNSFKCPDWIISQFNWFGFIATWGCELIQIFLLPHRLNLYYAFHVCESARFHLCPSARNLIIGRDREGLYGHPSARLFFVTWWTWCREFSLQLCMCSSQWTSKKYNKYNYSTVSSYLHPCQQWNIINALSKLSSSRRKSLLQSG